MSAVIPNACFTVSSICPNSQQYLFSVLYSPSWRIYVRLDSTALYFGNHLHEEPRTLQYCSSSFHPCWSMQPRLTPHCTYHFKYLTITEPTRYQISLNFCKTSLSVLSELDSLYFFTDIQTAASYLITIQRQNSNNRLHSLYYSTGQRCWSLENNFLQFFFFSKRKFV